MLRTITFEEYKENHRKLLGYWSERVHDLFYDAYRLWLNEEWIDARLHNNEFIEIYEIIIRESRSQLRYHKDEENVKAVTAILKKYQRKLFEELSRHMRDYCLDE